MLHVWNCVIDFCGTKQINRSGHLAWIWGWHTLFFVIQFRYCVLAAVVNALWVCFNTFVYEDLSLFLFAWIFNILGVNLCVLWCGSIFCVLWVCSEEYSLENTTVQFAFQFSTDLDWCGDGEGKENERPTSQCALRYASYAGSGVTGLEKMELYVVNTE